MIFTPIRNAQITLSKPLSSHARIWRSNEEELETRRRTFPVWRACFANWWRSEEVARWLLRSPGGAASQMKNNWEVLGMGPVQEIPIIFRMTCAGAFASRIRGAERHRSINSLETETTWANPQRWQRRLRSPTLHLFFFVFIHLHLSSIIAIGTSSPTFTKHHCSYAHRTTDTDICTLPTFRNGSISQPFQ